MGWSKCRGSHPAPEAMTPATPSACRPMAQANLAVPENPAR